MQIGQDLGFGKSPILKEAIFVSAKVLCKLAAEHDLGLVWINNIVDQPNQFE